MELYPSDLTDEEWAILEPLIPPEKPGGRPREVTMRAVLNGIFSVLRAGCAWRMIPREYPPKSTVYSYFARFRDEGVKLLLSPIKEVFPRMRKSLGGSGIDRKRTRMDRCGDGVGSGDRSA